MRTLTTEESNKLLALDYGIRNNTIIRLLYYTGLRVSELTGLINDDIYFGADVKKFLVVRAEISKTGDAREIPLCDKIRVVLKDYYNSSVSCDKTLSNESGRPIFQACGDSGTALTTRQVQRVIAEYGKRAGIQGLHPHMFRHTFATLITKQYGVAAAQKLLGHKSLQTTQIYVHLSSSDLTDAVNKL